MARNNCRHTKEIVNINIICHISSKPTKSQDHSVVETIDHRLITLLKKEKSPSKNKKSQTFLCFFLISFSVLSFPRITCCFQCSWHNSHDRYCVQVSINLFPKISIKTDFFFYKLSH